jgi:hypothetical protein
MHSAEGRAGDENDTRSRRVAGHMWKRITFYHVLTFLLRTIDAGRRWVG